MSGFHRGIQRPATEPASKRERADRAKRPEYTVTQQPQVSHEGEYGNSFGRRVLDKLLPVGTYDRQKRSSSTGTKVDPLDTGSLAAAGDKKVGDPQTMKQNTLTRTRDGKIGINVRGVGVGASGQRTDTSSRFTTNGRDPGKPQGKNPHLKTDPGAETFESALEYNKLGFGEGRTFTTRSDVAKSVTGGPVTLRAGDGKSREMSVYRPEIETDPKSHLVKKGGAHERLRVTTRERDHTLKGADNNKTGMGIDTKASRGTAYTYDVDPKNKKAVAAMKEYNRTGLMPGARELMTKGTPEQQAEAKRLLAEFDAQHARLAQAKTTPLSGYVDPKNPGMFPMLGAASKATAEGADASARFQAARKALNERWKQEYALSRAKPGDKNRGDIMKGLKLMREDKVATVDGQKAGTSHVRDPKTGRIRTDTF